MYFNRAYLYNSEAVVKDLTKPLMVTSCGYYRITNGPVIKTNRPKGRRDYQLLYVAEGRGKFIIEGCERYVNKGEMVLYRPYDFQSYFYYPSDKCEVFWVHFTGYDVDKLLDRYNFPKDKNVFFGGISHDYNYIFELIIRELQLRRSNYKELLPLLLTELFILINRNILEERNQQRSMLDEVENSVRYFNENYANNININEYAESLNITPCWLIKKFKQVVKQTPMQYIVALRIANAKTLLENSDYNVTETSYAVGYDNPLYFSRLFKKHVGMSPIEYKNKYSYTKSNI